MQGVFGARNELVVVMLPSGFVAAVAGGGGDGGAVFVHHRQVGRLRHLQTRRAFGSGADAVVGTAAETSPSSSFHLCLLNASCAVVAGDDSSLGSNLGPGAGNGSGRDLKLPIQRTFVISTPLVLLTLDHPRMSDCNFGCC